ncbi:MAG: SH3 domain-containing protein [Acaryochloris sp. RU_4_1]|nr:SH3 domain-containing protein [Acaryochloris sp. RU_4_1]NJR56169.1 SH3 domain-containing protein [Acaryochloris sp. CRU_2_0]
MKPSQLAQLVIGVSLGLAIVGSVVGGAGYLYLNRFSQIPERPKFANDNKPESKPTKPQPYPAVVTYADGLLLRKEQSPSSKVLKVLEYEEPVTVIEVSVDQKWQKIKTGAEGETNRIEGWVTAGNTQRVAAEPEPSQTPSAEEPAPAEEDAPAEEAVPAEQPAPAEGF